MDYKEKLRLAKEALDSGSYDKKTIEYLFPELKESEDERIRKSIIKLLQRGGYMSPEDKTKAFAWLEKKGEQTNPYSGVSFEYNGHVWGMCARDNGVDILLDKQLFKHLENQGDQTSTDEIKPKFKVGDWVVWDNKISYHIDNIYQGKESLMYTITDTNNMTCSYSVKDFDNNAHSWIVQDAKDGDVLAVNWQEGDDSWEKIIIFKKYHEKGVEGLTNTPCVEGYGNTFKNGKLAFHEEVPYFSQTWTVILHPATKEQRDLLFQKTKEAGYEWDVEKKELKKIEQKPNFCHHEVDLSNCSEEYCKAYYDGWNNCNQQHAQLEAEQKHTWSEEDEKMCQNLLECLRNGWKKLPADVSKCESWLKSLKEKYSWKPTDEQIKALDYVINLMASSESPTENDYYYNVFKDMRTHLKKLKEE